MKSRTLADYDRTPPVGEFCTIGGERGLANITLKYHVLLNVQ